MTTSMMTAVKIWTTGTMMTTMMTAVKIWTTWTMMTTSMMTARVVYRLDDTIRIAIHLIRYTIRIVDTYRRYVSDQIYDVTRHIFDKLVCTMLFITSALLRLECTIDCISGSVGHHQNVFPFIF